MIAGVTPPGKSRMKYYLVIIIACVAVLPMPLLFAVDAQGRQGVVDTSRSPHVKLRSGSMTDVRWTTGFWADRFELCCKSMLPTLHNTLLDPKCSAQLNRLKFTAGLQSVGSAISQTPQRWSS